MAPFLPIQAISRSQRIRIAGKTILPGVNNYIDLCQLNNPTALAEKSKTATGETGPGLAENGKYVYAIVANDAFGGTTLSSPLIEITAGAGTNGKTKEWNETTFEAAPVDFATSYSIYRIKATLTEVREKTAKEEEIAWELLTKTLELGSKKTILEYTDSGVTAIATKQSLPVVNNTYYNTNKTGYPIKRELQNHLAIGAILITGPAGPYASDWSVYVSQKTKPSELAEVLKLESNGVPVSKKVKVEKTGELRNRFTGQVVSVTELATATPTESAKLKFEVKSYIIANVQTKIVEIVKGKEVEGKGNAILPTLTPYQVPLASYSSYNKEEAVLIQKFPITV